MVIEAIKEGDGSQSVAGEFMLGFEYIPAFTMHEAYVVLNAIFARNVRDMTDRLNMNSHYDPYEELIQRTLTLREHGTQIPQFVGSLSDALDKEKKPDGSTLVSDIVVPAPTGAVVYIGSALKAYEQSTVLDVNLMAMMGATNNSSAYTRTIEGVELGPVMTIRIEEAIQTELDALTPKKTPFGFA